MKKLIGIVMVIVLGGAFVVFSNIKSQSQTSSNQQVATSTQIKQSSGSLLGAKGTIAFVKKQGRENHIYTVNVDGTKITYIANCLAGECYPSWSPDGTKIVFEMHEQGAAIYVIDVDGTNLVRLSPVPGRDVSPSWSPDGSKIIFTHIVTPSDSGIPDTEIDVMNADGSDVKMILASSGTFNIEPRWSPDGKKIVFMSNREGGQHIFTMNADGSDVKKITDTGANGDPAWSPDGKKIVFEWDVDGKGQSDPNVRTEVWVVNANGTRAESTNQACAAVGCSPRWRPK